MNPSLRFAAAAILVATCLRGAGASAAVPPDVDAAAKKEGTVVWYTSMIVPTINALIRRFQETHPGITVQPLRMGSEQLPARIITEERGGKYNADVISGDDFQFHQLLEAGAIARNPNPEASKFIKGTVDPNGYWTNQFANTTVLAWNPERLKADGLKPPASLNDLTKPEWKGKIGMDAGALNWYVGMLQDSRANGDFFKRFAANKPILTSGHTDTAVKLEAGEFDAAPTVYGYLADNDKRAGRPIDFLNPRPLLITLNPVGMVKNAPHPNAARVFIDWLVSKDGQTFMETLGEQSSRTDVPSNPRLWDPKRPFFVVRPPESAQYTQIVQQFKALFGIPG
ncbi:MAG TPA: extracellular solute-binding protein [Candidatus Acidoferrales bacterium]|nr:extracellular solute-binding protein [Candidatus Acidoferrales bacterium]